MESSTNTAQDLERYRGYLRVLARAGLGRRLRRRLDESDIVQETFLEAYRSRAQLRGTTEPHVRAWLRTILKRILSRVRRDHQREMRDIRMEVSIDELLDHSSARIACIGSLQAQGSTPSSKAMREERAVRIAAMLEELPEAQREVILLTYVDDLSTDEIAADIGNTAVAVASLRRRGLAELRARGVIVQRQDGM